MKAALLAAVSAFVLSGCAAGPDYVAPVAPPAAAAAFVTQTPATVSATPADAWWRLYRDPVLDGLVADALAANTDIRVAVARLDQARAALRGAKTDREPQVGLGASADYGRVSQLQALPGFDRERAVYDVGIDVSYEVDLAGRVRRNVEAARGDVGAAQADADAVRVSIVSATTRAYVDAASAAERLAVATRIVALLDRSTALTVKRAEAGRATKLDSVRLAALRDQRAAQVPAIAAERQAALFRLATLTGRAPADLPAVAAARATTPRLDQPIPVGDGAALLSRRPDVRAAERRLAAATARIGVATAELYPQIALGGSIGSTAVNAGDIFTGGPIRWLLGPLLNWTLNQSAARSRIAGAEADTRGALASFDGRILTALEETETALSNYAREVDRRTQLQSARDNAATAARITRARQREGQIDFLTVLDAERTFADADADLALADARIAGAQIDLFRALGGGWQDARLAAAHL